MSPLFIGQHVTFNGRIAAGAAMLWASGPDGGLDHQVELTLSDGAR
jgi:hypothetical protein